MNPRPRRPSQPIRRIDFWQHRLYRLIVIQIRVHPSVTIRAFYFRHMSKFLRRFHVCDMFIRLNRNKREGLPYKRVWKHLDYASQSFDGINLWDFIDHLNDNQVGQLVGLCHSLLKPRGMMIITSFEEQPAPSPINSFVIQDNHRLTFRLQNHLNLPWHYRSNRILTHMLSAFPSVKSFLYRNGIREFLCRRD
jgi:hypothetical protein